MDQNTYLVHNMKYEKYISKKMAQTRTIAYAHGDSRTFKFC